MRCENCGQVLTPQSDPLCVSCLHQLRAGPAPDPIEGQRARISSIDSGQMSGGTDDEESAA